MADEVVMRAVREALDAGYQMAVDALRDLVAEYGDEGMKVAIAGLADTLEALKPRRDA